MPRPKRPRHIAARPDIREFAPDGIAHSGETILTIEEFEAIRLSDYQDLDQSRAAEQMNVSRQTFGRILKQARYNLAQALVTGKRLLVTGGCYKMRKGGRRGRGRAMPGLEKTVENNRTKTINSDPGLGEKPGPDQGRGPGRRKGIGRGRGQGAGGCRRGKS